MMRVFFFFYKIHLSISITAQCIDSFFVGGWGESAVLSMEKLTASFASECWGEKKVDQISEIVCVYFVF